MKLLWRSPVGRVLVAASALLAVATVVGLGLLWPGDGRVDESAGVQRSVAAEVVRVDTRDCGGPQRQDCAVVVADVEGGPSATRMTLGPVNVVPEVQTGDAIRVARVEVPEGAAGVEPYGFVGQDRRGPLLWLALAVALLAVVVVRLRGVLALAGLVLSLALVSQFVLPAILEGTSPLLVVLVGAMAVTFITVVLTSGVGAQSLAAIAGIAITLALAAVLAVLVGEAAHLDGRSTQLSEALAQANRELSLEGVVVAAVVLGALGALTDTAVTQSSAVMALRRANASLGVRRLYREAFAVGRDHLSATVHTLVLAYTGAALPLLLALRGSGTPTADALSLQELAEPVAGTLIGALALIACVPLTTALAAALAVRLPPAAIPADVHSHAH